MQSMLVPGGLVQWSMVIDTVIRAPVRILSFDAECCWAARRSACGPGLGRPPCLQPAGSAGPTVREIVRNLSGGKSLSFDVLTAEAVAWDSHALGSVGDGRLSRHAHPTLETIVAQDLQLEVNAEDNLKMSLVVDAAKGELIVQQSGVAGLAEGHCRGFLFGDEGRPSRCRCRPGGPSRCRPSR